MKSEKVKTQELIRQLHIEKSDLQHRISAIKVSLGQIRTRYEYVNREYENVAGEIKRITGIKDKDAELKKFADSIIDIRNILEDARARLREQQQENGDVTSELVKLEATRKALEGILSKIP